MHVIISSTAERFGRAGFRFTRSGSEFQLLDSDSDQPEASPPGIGKKSYAKVAEEAKNGRLSVLPARLADALATPTAAGVRIAELEQALTAAGARIAELEQASKPIAKGGK